MAERKPTPSPVRLSRLLQGEPMGNKQGPPTKAGVYFESLEDLAAFYSLPELYRPYPLQKKLPHMIQRVLNKDDYELKLPFKEWPMALLRIMIHNHNFHPSDAATVFLWSALGEEFDRDLIIKDKSLYDHIDR